ncbi:MAG: anhydro-N-acetylmuramic acid kinase [Labedaea sp.]
MTSLRVIGLHSGTSVDGIDVAAAELRLTGGIVELLPLGHRGVDYPAELRAQLLAALPPGDCTADRLCRLDAEVGRAFADAAGAALTELAGGRADLVGSLGQLLCHRVDGGRCLGTLQLGAPALIAEHTGLPVVADLRARDVAAGGQGAPLAAVLDRLWLSGAGEPVAALHLGGMAGLTVVIPGASGVSTVALQTGPGNALLDAAARMISDGVWRQDVDGELAGQGTVRPDLLGALLADPYYVKPAPKSTGPGHFHTGYLRAALEGLPHVPAVDLLATLVELTAVTVAQACRGLDPGRVVVSGGGTHNPALLAALRRTLAPVPLVGSDELGLPADAKEAYLAALLGFLTWCGVPADTATGATGPRVLGSITPGRTVPRLPRPGSAAVTRLRVTAPVAEAVG